MLGGMRGTEEVLQGRQALVLAAHPDDETLGVGGIMVRLSRAGCEVSVVFYTRGDQGCADPGQAGKIAAAREAEAREAVRLLGGATCEFLDCPDMGLAADRETLHATIRTIRRFRPDLLFAHWVDDLHPDHQAAGRLAETALRFAGRPLALHLGEPWAPRALFSFETMKPFAPSHIVDISQDFDQVCQAFKCYTSQDRVIPAALQHLEGLTLMRGASLGVRHGQALLRLSPLPQPL